MAFQDLYTSSDPLTSPDTTFKRDSERLIADSILELGMQRHIYNFLQSNQKIREHADEIKQVVNLLSNDLSKQEYDQEIAFHTLKYIDFDFAYPLISFNLVKSNMFKKMAVQIFDTPKFPKIYSDQNATKVMMIDTFVVDQYRYRNPVKVDKGDIFIDAALAMAIPLYGTTKRVLPRSIALSYARSTSFFSRFISMTTITTARISSLMSWAKRIPS